MSTLIETKIEDFILKLSEKNLFLKVSDGDLLLKGLKGKLSETEIAYIRNDDTIIDFIKNNKEGLLSHLEKNKGGLKKQNQKTENITAIYELTPLQEGMLFHTFYDKESNVYVVQNSFDILSEINVDAFKAAFSYILEKHTALRTGFILDHFSKPVQCVFKDIQLPFSFYDYSTLTGIELERKAKRFIADDLGKNFDFNRPPLLRITLLKLAPAEYKLVWTNHHIILDGWSMPVLFNELFQAYELLAVGQNPKIKEVDQYEDFIKYIRSKDKFKEENFWKEYLSEFTSPSLIPFVNNKLERNKAGDYLREISWNGDEAFTERLKNFAKENHLTVNTLVQGVWSFLLARYTGKTDTVMGVTVSGRPTDIDNIEERIGLFINTIPLRSTFDENQKVVDWLTNLQKKHTEAREYQFTALNQIQAWNGIKGDFFDSILVFENYPIEDNIPVDSLLKVGNVNTIEETNYLITLMVVVGASVNVKFSSHDFLIKGFLDVIKGHFVNVLTEIVNNKDLIISEIKVYTPEEKQKLLVDYNDTFLDYPRDKTFIDHFEKQVDQSPENIALKFEDQSLTYKELDEKSDRLANYLSKKGVTHETLVTICLDRSLNMVVGLLGILKVGGAFIPIDPEFPVKRIEHIIETANSKFILTDNKNTGLFDLTTDNTMILIDEDGDEIGGMPSLKMVKRPGPNNLAYVIFTSGSTGKPKGVMIEHKALFNLLSGMVDLLKPTEESSLLAITTYSFDISYLELFLPLLVGGKVIVANKETTRNPLLLKDLIVSSKPTYMQATPVTWQMLLSCEWRNEENVIIMCGGEAIKEPLKNDLVGLSNQKVWNLYGPTETTIWSTACQLKLRKKVEIGAPIANTGAFILNRNPISDNLELAPIGIVGDLYLSGDGLARGYLDQKELTDEKFITWSTDDIENLRIYKTGDLAIRLPNGSIECLGREDGQVKIRGFRVETGEIESVLQQCKHVNECVVITRPDSSGSLQLVAFFTAPDNYDKRLIDTFLKRRVPTYMIPSKLVELIEMPLTPNGKIDKLALPDSKSTQVVSTEYVAPRNPTEEQLVEVWKEILDVEKIGIHDDFFELGGYSLTAFRLIIKVNKLFNTSIEVATLFNAPTISLLHQYIKLNVIEEGSSVLKTIVAGESERAIFCIAGAGGNVMSYYRLGQLLGSKQSFFGFQSHGLDGKSKILTSVEDIAKSYIIEMQKVDPIGPYNIGGYSMGAILAFEMAIQLKKNGFEVENLIILDGDAPAKHTFNPLANLKRYNKELLELVYELAEYYDKEVSLSLSDLKWKTKEQKLDLAFNEVLAIMDVGPTKDILRAHIEVAVNAPIIVESYFPKIRKPLDISIILFETEKEPDDKKIPLFEAWSKLTTRPIQRCKVSGNHNNFLNDPHVHIIADFLKEQLGIES